MARLPITIEEHFPYHDEKPRSGWEVLAAAQALTDFMDPQTITLEWMRGVGDAIAKAWKAGRVYESAVRSNDSRIVLRVCGELGLSEDANEDEIVRWLSQVKEAHRVASAHVCGTDADGTVTRIKHALGLPDDAPDDAVVGVITDLKDALAEARGEKL